MEPWVEALIARGRRTGYLTFDEVNAVCPQNLDPEQLAALTDEGGWRPLAEPADDVWRDEFASILPHLTWRNFF